MTEYVGRIPPVLELCTQHKLEPEAAFHLCRPVLTLLYVRSLTISAHVLCCRYLLSLSSSRLLCVVDFSTHAQSDAIEKEESTSGRVAQHKLLDTVSALVGNKYTAFRFRFSSLLFSSLTSFHSFVCFALVLFQWQHAYLF